MQRIGVLTSGGDAPGMNAAVRAVTRQALNLDLEVMGISRGYSGFIKGEISELKDKDVSGKINRGGTFLFTARSEKFKNAEGQEEAIFQLKNYGIEALVIIGGDGSLQGAMALERQGIPTVGVPASIDNDLSGTDYSIGFDTAVNTVVEAVDKIRDTATSHERVFVIETMGRNNGLLTLESGLAVGAEAILIPEIEFDIEEVCGIVRKGYESGKSHNLIMVAEGIKDCCLDQSKKQEKHYSAAFQIGEIITENTGFEVRIIVLGHVQRGGSPSALDRVTASKLGSKAVEVIKSGGRGVMVGINQDKIVTVDYDVILEQEKQIDESLYNLAKILG